MSVLRVISVLLFAGLLLATAEWSGSAAQEQNAPASRAPNAAKRLNAAKEVYESSWQRLQQEPDDAPDEVEHYYRWSVRWMQAEREIGRTRADRIATLEGHLKRMQLWKKRMSDGRDQGEVPANEVAAAEFFFLEAEDWLTEAKAAEK